MKIPYTILLTCSFCLFISAFQSDYHIQSNSQGAPAGNTGSPFDNKTCARSGCHPGTASFVSGIISSNVPPTGYIPGSTYTITCSCSQSGINRWGFEVSPMNPAGALQGNLLITNVDSTKITSSKYVTHTLKGTQGVGAKTWSFNWVAPLAGSGSVTFYGAFNYSNSNGMASGDIIKTSNLTITENVTASVVDFSNQELELRVIENPVHDVVRIVFNSGKTEKQTIRILNQNGQLMKEKIIQMLAPGIHEEAIVAPEKSGIYFIVVISDSKAESRKFIKL